MGGACFFVYVADLFDFFESCRDTLLDVRSYERLASCSFEGVELVGFLADWLSWGMFLGSTMGELAAFFFYLCMKTISRPGRFSSGLSIVACTNEAVGVSLKLLVWTIYGLEKSRLCHVLI